VQTTEIYLRADPTAKLEAIESVLPPTLRRGRFLAPDKLLASLQSPGAPASVERGADEPAQVIQRRARECVGLRLQEHPTW
jgi:hypothetical protein